MKRNETLLAVSLTGLLLLALTQAAAAQAPPELGMLEVTVQVDGLSCPFCAYGLEKKLRKVENVARIEIRVNEGRAVVTPESGTSLELDELEQAVRDGGFTPREVSVTARGRLTELNGAAALELSNGILLLLAEGSQTNALLRSPTGSVVRVEGQAAPEQPDGHAGHPYTLTVRSFEVA